MVTDKGITTGDGYATGFRERAKFTRLWKYREAEVYCPDWTVRRIEGFARKKMEFTFADLFFWNPFYTAELVLSEPVRQYTLAELVKLVILRDTRKIQDSGLRKETVAKLRQATTFDDVLALVPLM